MLKKLLLAASLVLFQQNACYLGMNGKNCEMNIKSKKHLKHTAGTKHQNRQVWGGYQDLNFFFFSVYDITDNDKKS